MPIISQFDQQNQQNDQNQQDNNQFQPVSMGGSQAGGTGGGIAAPQAGQAAGAPNAPGAPGAPTRSGRFTNLQQYIKASQPYNQAGGGFAGQIAQNVQQRAGGIQQQFGQAQQQFQQQAEAGRQQYRPEQMQQALADPSKFAGSQENVSNFQKMLGASYQGPQAIQGAEQYQQQAAQLQSLANLSQREKDRPALLQQLYGMPSYTGGQRSLDALLLQAQPGQLESLQQIRGIAGGAAEDIGARIGQAQQQAQQYGQEAQATQAAAKQALGGAITGFDESTQKAIQDAIAGRQKAFETQKSMLGQGIIGQEEATKLGLPQELELYGVRPEDYLSQSQLSPTRQNILSQEQASKVQALQKLAGGAALSPEAMQAMAQYQGELKPGEFSKQAAYNIDKDRMMQDIAAQKAGFEREISPYRQSTAPRRAELEEQIRQMEQESVRSGFMGSIGKQTRLGEAKAELASLQGVDYTLGQGGLAGTGDLGKDVQSLQDYYGGLSALASQGPGSRPTEFAAVQSGYYPQLIQKLQALQSQYSPGRKLRSGAGAVANPVSTGAIPGLAPSVRPAGVDITSAQI